jgi:hypothetical protein
VRKISSIPELQLAIHELEDKQARDWPKLKLEILKTVDDLKPGNFIKNSIKDAVASDGIKESLLVSAVSLATGFATKALIVGQSNSPLKRFLGTLVQLSLTKLISKHPKTVNLVAENLMAHFQDKLKNETTNHVAGK